MRLLNVLGATGLATAFTLSVMPATALAAPSGPSGCYSWRHNDSVAYGTCTRVPSGPGRWRLGIKCSDGKYDWSSWKSSAVRTSKRCPTPGTTLRNDWIDYKY